MEATDVEYFKNVGWSVGIGEVFYKVYIILEGLDWDPRIRVVQATSDGFKKAPKV